MAVDTSLIGSKTGAWRVVLDRTVLANFAKAVGDTSSVYRRAGRGCPRCGGEIRSRGLGDENRTAYWCPACQRGEDPLGA